MTTEDDRIAYLSGEIGPDGLDPDDQTDLDALRELLATPSTWAQPAASLEDQVVAAVAAKAAKEPGAVSGSSRSRGSRITADSRQPSGFRHRGLYGAAAAVILAAAVAVGVLGRRSSSPHVSAALTGTYLAPGASATARLTRTDAGWQIDLRATGLPRLDNGRFYEAWMKNSAGVLVPIGTFNEGPRVTLWAGVSPFDFPTITVTEQEANGNPASSGQRVLTGTVQAPRSP